MHQMVEEVYGELHRIAGGYVRRERAQSVQATDLVHEAYLRLAREATPRWQNRTHFIAIAAIAMRRFGSYDGSCFTLAVTATDHRMDNKPLHGATGAIFEDVVFRFGLRDAVREGWLVDLRDFRVATDVDLSGIKSVGGDYNQGQLARAVNTQERNYTAYRHWREVAGDRRTIVFCVDVQHVLDQPPRHPASSTVDVGHHQRGVLDVVVARVSMADHLERTEFAR